MFCPKCGQSQVSEQVRFCSRCGFPLGGVTDLLARNGIATHQQADAPRVSPRRRGMRRGGKLMFFGVIISLMLGILVGATDGPGEVVALSAVIFVAGFFRVLYALLFEDKSPAPPQPPEQAAYAQHAAGAQFIPGARGAALPHGDFVPARASFPPRQDTAEIAPPPSVTDHTTRLLRDEDEAPGR
ncbi:MAG TPA: zinc ribbon domain-containing protein [Pyrinomonadaceae bacterium]|jgi:hypothetical protein